MMQEPTNERTPIDELDWLAFCYVSGELLDHERIAFENRLADDQAAREAVAQTVELLQAVAAADSHGSDKPTPAHKPQRSASRPRRLVWTSVGASTAMVLAIAWMRFDTIAAWFAPPAVDRGELAEVWSQTRETVREIVQSEPLDAMPFALETDPTSDAIPSWMTAAIFQQPAGTEQDKDHETYDES